MKCRISKWTHHKVTAATANALLHLILISRHPNQKKKSCYEPHYEKRKRCAITSLQKFRPEWTKKKWFIRSVSDDCYTACCDLCHSQLRVSSRGKAAIECHLESSKHLAKAKVVLDQTQTKIPMCSENLINDQVRSDLHVFLWLFHLPFFRLP